MCGVLTRNVGVGHQYPNMKTVSTATAQEIETNFSDKWLLEKKKFLNIPKTYNLNDLVYKNPVLIPKGTQTLLQREKRETHTQTEPVQKTTKNIFVQTLDDKKYVKDASISAVVKSSDCYIQTSADVKNIGVSENTVNDILCEKCECSKVSVAVRPDTIADGHLSPISLASLAVPRSKSFNLGEDKLNLSSRNRSVACQYEPSGYHKACQSKPSGYHKACQYESTSLSKSCQHEVSTSHKSLQSENLTTFTKTTDTNDLGPLKKNVGCEVKEKIKNFSDIGCNTVNGTTPQCVKCLKEKEKDKEIGEEKKGWSREKDSGKEKGTGKEKESRKEIESGKEKDLTKEKDSTKEESYKEKENKKEKHKEIVATKKEENLTPSRIPRPQIPTTPVENRKFKRQDTYTKIPSDEKTPPPPPTSLG